ncbi:7561_t:CDS:2 [Ambispora gerdemannii]|uniref:7561_t:CDS:1 n=1 Tax=Ambispora gerdemannii TaxID=144530 RepID=A0A9N8YT20_9GLOM|nr:7561_t:CDS:2 [Ambispora gerdemannii]
MIPTKRKKWKVVQGLVAIPRNALVMRGDLILRKGIYEYGTSEDMLVDLCDSVQ